MAFYMPPLAAEADPVGLAAVTAEIAARIAADVLEQDASTAATDVELASAVSSLTTAIVARQEAATAATDVELAAAQASLTAAVAAVQAVVDANAAAGATDVEVASAVAALAATVATDAELAAAVALDRARLDAVESSRQFYGSTAAVQPLLDALPVGTEYAWTKTNGAGVLLDILTGVTT